MQIGVDAGGLGITDDRLKAGVFQVAKNLFEQLKIVDKKNTYILYSFYPIDTALLAKFGSNVKSTVVYPARGWSKFWLPIRLMKDNIDLFLGLNQALPQQHLVKYRSIVFFYDLAFEKYPGMYPDSYKKLRSQSLYAAKHADTIITISRTTKKDMHTLYKTPEDKMHVAYLGVNDIFLTRQFKKNPRKKPYFLFVGALKRIKNIPRIIQGFSYFYERTKPPYELLLVGGDKWLDPEIDKTILSLEKTVKNNIIYMGFVSDEEMVNLYRYAVALVSPSLYEGFGLPFVEAMSCDCPVIGSRVGSIAEIVKDAGILVDPNDYMAIGEAMIAIATNGALRAQLIRKGRERVKYFSWRHFAQNVYKQIEYYA